MDSRSTVTAGLIVTRAVSAIAELLVFIVKASMSVLHRGAHIHQPS